MQEETRVLGLILGRNGVKIREDFKRLIPELPIRKSATEFRSFLRLLLFLRGFIDCFRRIVVLLAIVSSGMIASLYWEESITQFLHWPEIIYETLLLCKLLIAHIYFDVIQMLVRLLLEVLSLILAKMRMNM